MNDKFKRALVGFTATGALAVGAVIPAMAQESDLGVTEEAPADESVAPEEGTGAEDTGSGEKDCDRGSQEITETVA